MSIITDIFSYSHYFSPLSSLNNANYDLKLTFISIFLIPSNIFAYPHIHNYHPTMSFSNITIDWFYEDELKNPRFRLVNIVTKDSEFVRLGQCIVLHRIDTKGWYTFCSDKLKYTKMELYKLEQTCSNGKDIDRDILKAWQNTSQATMGNLIKLFIEDGNIDGSQCAMGIFARYIVEQEAKKILDTRQRPAKDSTVSAEEYQVQESKKDERAIEEHRNRIIAEQMIRDQELAIKAEQTLRYEEEQRRIRANVDSSSQYWTRYKFNDIVNTENRVRELCMDMQVTWRMVGDNIGYPVRELDYFERNSQGPKGMFLDYAAKFNNMVPIMKAMKAQSWGTYSTVSKWILARTEEDNKISSIASLTLNSEVRHDSGNVSQIKNSQVSSQLSNDNRNINTTQLSSFQVVSNKSLEVNQVPIKYKILQSPLEFKAKCSKNWDSIKEILSKNGLVRENTLNEWGSAAPFQIDSFYFYCLVNDDKIVIGQILNALSS